MNRHTESAKSLSRQLLAIILFLLTTSMSSAEPTTIYELYIDFGNDNVFLHEVTPHKWYCEERVKFIQKTEGIKAYCRKRNIVRT